MHLANYMSSPIVKLERVTSLADSEAGSELSERSRTKSLKAAAFETSSLPEIEDPNEGKNSQPPPVWHAEGKKDDNPAPKKLVEDEAADPRIATGVITFSPTVYTDGQVPRELGKTTLPPYVVEPPDILLVEVTQTVNESVKAEQFIRGQHLIRPDGTINLGIYGSVQVNGMSLEQVREAVFKRLEERKIKLQLKDVNVDVLAYNSKVYYVITDGGGYGEQVTRVPVTGNETVLDAIGQIGGLPSVASKKRIWVARRTVASGACKQLPVDWVGITQRGEIDTNYQVLPGDRIYVHSDKAIRIDSWLGKRLAPIERILGGTLLGSEAANSLQGKPIR
jgi:polysaccharide export outer membrane protein